VTFEHTWLAHGLTCAWALDKPKEGYCAVSPLRIAVQHCWIDGRRIAARKLRKRLERLYQPMSWAATSVDGFCA
jgi:hypothetical protein